MRVFIARRNHIIQAAIIMETKSEVSNFIGEWNQLGEAFLSFTIGKTEYFNVLVTM